jgi:hypothetical protein
LLCSCDPSSTCSPYRAHVPTLDGEAQAAGQQQEQQGGEQERGRVLASRVCNSCFGLKMSKIAQLAPKDMEGLIQKFMSKRSTPSARHAGPASSQTEDDASVAHETPQCRISKKKEKRAEIESLQFQLLEEPKYSKAYRRMRCMIPPYIASMSLPSLMGTGLPTAVAERIWSKRSLWLIIMHPQDIRKIHIADLRAKYTPMGLDLTERYAVWHSLPDWEGGAGEHADSVRSEGEGHADSAKAEWKCIFKVQMDEMARQHARGELRGDQVRHRAYEGHEPLHLFSHRAAIHQLYSNDTTRPNPKHYITATSDVTSSSSLLPPPVSPASPASSAGSSQLSATPCLCDERDRDNEDHCSPVVPLFVHRQTAPTTASAGKPTQTCC